jgi:hypothetical protein
MCIFYFIHKFDAGGSVVMQQAPHNMIYHPTQAQQQATYIAQQQAAQALQIRQNNQQHLQGVRTRSGGGGVPGGLAAATGISEASPAVARW